MWTPIFVRAQIYLWWPIYLCDDPLEGPRTTCEDSDATLWNLHTNCEDVLTPMRTFTALWWLSCLREDSLTPLWGLPLALWRPTHLLHWPSYVFKDSSTFVRTLTSLWGHTHISCKDSTTCFRTPPPLWGSPLLCEDPHIPCKDSSTFVRTIPPMWGLCHPCEDPHILCKDSYTFVRVLTHTGWLTYRYFHNDSHVPVRTFTFVGTPASLSGVLTPLWGSHTFLRASTPLVRTLTQIIYMH